MFWMQCFGLFNMLKPPQHWMGTSVLFSAQAAASVRLMAYGEDCLVQSGGESSLNRQVSSVQETRCSGSSPHQTPPKVFVALHRWVLRELPVRSLARRSLGGKSRMELGEIGDLAYIYIYI